MRKDGLPRLHACRALRYRRSTCRMRRFSIRADWRHPGLPNTFRLQSRPARRQSVSPAGGQKFAAGLGKMRLAVTVSSSRAALWSSVSGIATPLRHNTALESPAPQQRRRPSDHNHPMPPHSDLPQSSFRLSTVAACLAAATAAVKVLTVTAADGEVMGRREARRIRPQFSRAADARAHRSCRRRAGGCR